MFSDIDNVFKQNYNYLNGKPCNKKGSEKSMKINDEKLEIAMANKCMTINQLAAKSGVSRMSLANYTANRRNPKPSTVGKIAKALDVKVEDLIQ